jgi:hypothetical protein
LAQDGVRVRAAAGAGSYRRRPRLEQLLRDAEARVAALKAELESDPAASTARQRAARQRAARERVERTNAAARRDLARIAAGVRIACLKQSSGHASLNASEEG